MTGIYSHLLHWLVISGIFLLLNACNFSEDKSQTSSEPVYASLIDTTRYVGMSTCRQCHSAIYDTYIQTGMGQSFAAASHSKSSAHFDEHVVVRDSSNGYLYHPGWEGDSLYLLEFLMHGKDTIYKRKERINYIVGSGQHTNSHINNTNGYLYPVSYTHLTLPTSDLV